MASPIDKEQLAAQQLKDVLRALAFPLTKFLRVITTPPERPYGHGLQTQITRSLNPRKLGLT